MDKVKGLSDKPDEVEVTFGLKATGGGDGTARLWGLQLSELVDLACRTAGRNFTRGEWRTYFSGKEYRPTCPSLPVPKE